MSQSMKRKSGEAEGGSAEELAPQGSVSIDWYSDGESRTVKVGGLQMTVRLVGQRGRRSRIVIEAPAGAVFSQE